MAFRVDNIQVSEKNVFIIDDDNTAFVADIEKETDSLDENDYDRDRNPWNLYDSDGKIYNNLFSVGQFKLRSQILVGKPSDSPNVRENHEKIYAPNSGKFYGMAQLYDTVYGITNRFSDSITSTYSTDTNGTESTYSADYGFCQYSAVSSLTGTTDNFISPKRLYTPTTSGGIQYLVEFPFNGFYNDFGDNEDFSSPTVFCDSVQTKYHLSNTYSSSGQIVKGNNIRFKRMRDYYGVGSTGNSIYLVYRSKLTGKHDNVQNADGTGESSSCTKVPITDLNKLGYMDNVITYSYSDESGSIYYSSDFKKGFKKTSLVINSDFVYQPKDLSFILYVANVSGKIKFTYVPKIGGIFNSYSKTLSINETTDTISVVEMEHSVAVGTKSNGLFIAWSKNHSYDTSSALTVFNPFFTPTIGLPDSTNEYFTEYSDFTVRYNGSDILGITCKKNNERYAFFTTDFEYGDKSYSIGQYFQHATSYGLGDAIVSDILFDYCPIDYDNEVKIGSYAFVQFKNVGLGRCHKDDLISETGHSTFDSNGPVNVISDNSKIAVDIHFVTTSHVDSTADDAVSSSELVKDEMATNTIKSKPMVVVSYKTSNSEYLNSFSCFPSLSSRSILTENTKTVGDSTTEKNVEFIQNKQYYFINDVPIENSMGVTLRSWSSRNKKHDASVCLVKWNDKNGLCSYQNKDFGNDNTQLDGTTHLQFSSICSELFINSNNSSSSSENGEGIDATILEYPHPSYGELTTDGDQNIKIFESPLSDDMTIGDLMMVNNFFVVKNYHTKEVNFATTPRTQPATAFESDYRNSGKIYTSIVPKYPNGGYVVTNFFNDSSTDTIGGLYSSVDENEDSSECSYTSLYHIKPSTGIKFYPKCENGKTWKPYYSGKYVNFIKYHNGYYYIGIRSQKDTNSSMIGYDIVETKSLFEEQPVTRIGNKFVDSIKFCDDKIAVRYGIVNPTTSVVSGYVINVFNQGDILTKFEPSLTAVTEQESDKSVNKIELTFDENISREAYANYDNVETLYSLNRFASDTAHKSTLFSVRIDDLGIDDSTYLTDVQKKNIKVWLKNRVFDIVNAVKPAQTEIFDVYFN